MNDRAISLLEQYDIEVLRTRKGRGAFICDTRQGSITLKEYRGNPQRLELQQQILQRIKELGLVQAEELLACKENQLYVKDHDGVYYIVKTYYEGSECNIYDGRERVEAIQQLARLHHCMEGAVLPQDIEIKEEQGLEAGREKNLCSRGEADKQREASAEHRLTYPVPYSPLKEYEKHNRELTRVWSYLKKKGQKQIFEMRLLGVMEYFVNQACRVTESWRELEEGQGTSFSFCHGDYQYHNIIRTQEGWRIINFEKLQADNPIRDVYLFLRKVMEKNNWLIPLGQELLASYVAIRSLDDYSRMDLYYRFAYPEKFWKIANFYYNSGKAWIPEKNLEKLERVISQEKEKQAFLREVFPQESSF